MNNSILARPPQTGQQIIDTHGSDTLELPLHDVNTGMRNSMSITPKIGDRFVAIYRQGPLGERFNREHLSADIIDPAGNLGSNPEPGYQWGFNDEDDTAKFCFTVVGIYVLDAITPNMADLTFSASFHRAPQEATA